MYIYIYNICISTYLYAYILYAYVYMHVYTYIYIYIWTLYLECMSDDYVPLGTHTSSPTKQAKSLAFRGGRIKQRSLDQNEQDSK